MFSVNGLSAQYALPFVLVEVQESLQELLLLLNGLGR
jgi:hypothetical protein